MCISTWITTPGQRCSHSCSSVRGFGHRMNIEETSDRSRMNELFFSQWKKARMVLNFFKLQLFLYFVAGMCQKLWRCNVRLPVYFKQILPVISKYLLYDIKVKCVSYLLFSALTQLPVKNIKNNKLYKVRKHQLCTDSIVRKTTLFKPAGTLLIVKTRLLWL